MKERILVGAIIILLGLIYLGIATEEPLLVETYKNDFKTESTNFSDGNNTHTEYKSYLAEKEGEGINDDTESISEPDDELKFREPLMSDQEMVSAWELLASKGKDISYYVVENRDLPYGFRNNELYGYIGDDKDNAVKLAIIEVIETDFAQPYLVNFDKTNDGYDTVYVLKNNSIHSNSIKDSDHCGLYKYKDGKYTKILKYPEESSCYAPSGIHSINQENGNTFTGGYNGGTRRISEYINLKDETLRYFDERKTKIFPKDVDITVFYNEGDWLVFSPIVSCFWSGMNHAELHKKVWVYQYSSGSLRMVEDISDWVVSGEDAYSGEYKWDKSARGEYTVVSIDNFNSETQKFEYEYEINHLADCGSPLY